MTRVHPKASISTLKPSFTEKPTSSRERHFMLTLQHHRNPNVSIKTQAVQSHAKPTDTPKFTDGHFIVLQRQEIHLHPPEHQLKHPLPGSFDKPLVETHPQGATSTIRRNYQLPAHRKGTPIQQSKQNDKAQKYSAGKGT